MDDDQAVNPTEKNFLIELLKDNVVLSKALIQSLKNNDMTGFKLSLAAGHTSNTLCIAVMDLLEQGAIALPGETIYYSNNVFFLAKWHDTQTITVSQTAFDNAINFLLNNRLNNSNLPYWLVRRGYLESLKAVLTKNQYLACAFGISPRSAYDTILHLAIECGNVAIVTYLTSLTPLPTLYLENILACKNKEIMTVLKKAYDNTLFNAEANKSIDTLIEEQRELPTAALLVFANKMNASNYSKLLEKSLDRHDGFLYVLLKEFDLNQPIKLDKNTAPMIIRDIYHDEDATNIFLKNIKGLPHEVFFGSEANEDNNRYLYRYVIYFINNNATLTQKLHFTRAFLNHYIEVIGAAIEEDKKSPIVLVGRNKPTKLLAATNFLTHIQNCIQSPQNAKWAPDESSEEHTELTEKNSKLGGIYNFFTDHCKAELDTASEQVQTSAATTWRPNPT